MVAKTDASPVGTKDGRDEVCEDVEDETANEGQTGSAALSPPTEAEVIAGLRAGLVLWAAMQGIDSLHMALMRFRGEIVGKDEASSLKDFKRQVKARRKSLGLR